MLGVFSFGKIGNHEYVWNYSKYDFLNIWGMWDSGWYLEIAKNWYPSYDNFNLYTLGQTKFNFFPLYPGLVKVFGVLLFNNFFIVGILLSNTFLFLSAYFLFRLVELEHNKKFAKKSLVYLFLAPASFILSAVFTESLFLFLIIFSIYNARRGKWFLACLVGLFLALTKSIGVLVAIPLSIIYLKQTKFKFQNIRPDIFYFFLIPLGTLIFSIFNYIKTGDFLAFLHSQQISWGHKAGNPFMEVIDGFYSNFFEQSINAVFTIFLIAYFIFAFKKIKIEYWLYSMSIIFIHLFAGATMNSMFRYSLLIFPLYISLPLVVANKYIEKFLWFSLIILQGWIMALWVNAYLIVV